MMDAPPVLAEEVREILIEMLRFVETHPGAKDSSAGVHQFWIRDGLERFSHEQVEEALDWLAGRGVLKSRGEGVGRLISLSKDALDGMQAHLDALDSGD